MSIWADVYAKIGDVEDEFWRAHNEVFEATGVRQLLNGTAVSSLNITAMYDDLKRESFAFYNAVNWSEPFFAYLGAFHVLICLTVLFASWGAVSDERLLGVCAGIAVLMLVGVPGSSYAAKHPEWLFQEPGVNYFTEDGYMLVIIYLIPLLFSLAYLQIRLGYRVVSLLIEVKRAQLRRRLRQEAMAMQKGTSKSTKTE